MRIQLLILSIVLILVSSCNSGYKKDIYVFKGTLKNDSISLLVDNKEIGQIPYVDTIQKTNITANAMLFRLNSGRHEISAKDRDGNYLSSVLIDITEKDLNIGPFNYSKNKTSVTIVNTTNNKYSFKDRSSKALFIFSLE